MERFAWKCVEICAEDRRVTLNKSVMDRSRPREKRNGCQRMIYNKNVDLKKVVKSLDYYSKGILLNPYQSLFELAKAFIKNNVDYLSISSSTLSFASSLNFKL